MKKKMIFKAAVLLLSAVMPAATVCAESFSKTLESFITIPDKLIEYKNPKENFFQRYRNEPREMKVVMPFEVSGNIQIFVSPDGSDAADGSIKKPLKTLSAALRKVERLTYDERAEGIVIYLRGGDYPTHKCIELNGRHSGLPDTPLYISAYNGEKVIFTTSDVIHLSDFRPVEDESIKQRFYPYARDKILEVSLPEHGITNYGSVNYDDEYNKTYSKTETNVYSDNENMTLARYPNIGMLRLGELIDSGPSENKDDHGEGHEWTMADDVPLHWQYKDDIGVFAYYSYNYWPEKKRIMGFNPEKMSVRCFGRIANSEKLFKNSTQNTYYFYNVLEELDTEGEWYIDRSTGKLYIYPLSYSDENTDIYVSAGDNDIMNLQDVNNIVINGITFKNSSANGISVSDGKRCVVQNCSFTSMGKGVAMSNCTNSGITTCYFGGTPASVSRDRFDSDSLRYFYGDNNFIQNCFLEGAKNTEKTIRLTLSGNNSVMSHNFTSDLTHGSFGGAGSNWYLEYNESVGSDKVQSDGAPYYTGGVLAAHNIARYNYIHHPGVKDKFGRGLYYDEGDSNFTAYGNIIHGSEYASFSHNGKWGVWYNNLFIENEKNAATSANYFNQYKKFRTRAMYDHENSWYYVLNRHSYDPGVIVWAKLYPEEQIYADKIKKYQDEVREDKPDMQENEKWLLTANYFYIANNLNLGGRYEIANTSLDTSIIENNYEVTKESFADYDNGDFTITDKEILNKLPDWEQLSTDKVGLIKDCDMWRNLKIGEFKKIKYPKSGYENRVSPSNIFFDWAKVRGAAFYRLTIAEDENFENIVYDEEVGYPSAYVSLNAGGHYWFKVTALSKAKTLDYGTSESETVDFYTMTVDESNAVLKADKTNIRKALSKAQEVHDSIVEGTNPGEYPEGTKQRLQSYINNTKSYVDETNIQGYIDDKEVEIYKNIYETKKTVNLGKVVNLDVNAGRWNKIENPNTAGNQDKPISLSNNPDGSLVLNTQTEDVTYISSDEKIPYGSFLAVKVKIDSLFSWQVFAGLAFEKAAYGLGTSQDLYSIILSADGTGAKSIELQKYKLDAGRKEFLTLLNNGEVRENEWCDLVLGAVPYEDGTRFICIMGDKVVYDYYDSFENGAYYMDSYFVHNRNTQNAVTEFAKSDITYDEIMNIINNK